MTKPKRPYATNAKRRSVTITESDWQKLKELGKGNASDGIRKAIQAAPTMSLEHAAEMAKSMRAPSG